MLHLTRGVEKWWLQLKERLVKQLTPQTQQNQTNPQQETNYCFPLLESAPNSPRMGSLLSPKENTEMSNFQAMSKGLSTSLPDLDSEPWIEVNKRHCASTVKLKVRSKIFKSCLNKQIQNLSTFGLYHRTRFFTT